MKRTILTLILAIAAATPVAAQEHRHGYWLAIGLGGTSASLDCPTCTGRLGNGIAFQLDLGGTLDPRWLLGISAFGMAPFDAEDRGADTDGYGGVLFTTRHYPAASRNVWLGAGLGVGYLTLVADDIDVAGYAAQVGAGWDIRIRPGGSITPVVTLTQAFGLDRPELARDTESDIGVRLLIVGLTLNLH